MKINEIFRSINGEWNLFGQGSWATFIRMQGCTLGIGGCSYCDTKQAQDGELGSECSSKEIHKAVQQLHCQNILITGGEPFEQEGDLSLLCRLLKDSGYFISVETNGTHCVENLIPNVDCFIVDWKGPSAISEDVFNYKNLNCLREKDLIKHVILNEGDYQFAKEKAIVYKQFNHVFSPCLSEDIEKNVMQASMLYNKMEKDSLFHVKFNYQIHKLIGCK